MKTCGRCKRWCSLQDFTVCASAPDGLDRNCRTCKKDKQLRTKYGITLADFKEMERSQDGRCLICARKPGGRSLSVDHCHKTGRVRGLLCYRCNQFLGYINDRTEPLVAAIEHLQGPVKS